MDTIVRDEKLDKAARDYAIDKTDDAYEQNLYYYGYCAGANYREKHPIDGLWTDEDIDDYLTDCKNRMSTSAFKEVERSLQGLEKWKKQA